MHIEQMVSGAKTLRGLIARAERQWTSSALGLAYQSIERHGPAGVSFQRMLRDAERQGMTLREFERHLARMRIGLGQ